MIDTDIIIRVAIYDGTIQEAFRVLRHAVMDLPGGGELEITDAELPIPHTCDKELCLQVVADGYNRIDHPRLALIARGSLMKKWREMEYGDVVQMFGHKLTLTGPTGRFAGEIRTSSRSRETTGCHYQ